jgi:hypothetical protein
MFNLRATILLKEAILDSSRRPRKDGTKAQSVFGIDITNYWIRTEFPGRGSPHLHGLFWLNLPPSATEADIAALVDPIISALKNPARGGGP